MARGIDNMEKASKIVKGVATTAATAVVAVVGFVVKKVVDPKNNKKN